VVFFLTIVYRNGYISYKLAVSVKLIKKLTISDRSENFRGARLTKHLTGNQRVSLLEEMRREAMRVFHHEYPRRLRRVLEVTQRKIERSK
jgi:hypothetical protein